MILRDLAQAIIGVIAVAYGIIMIMDPEPEGIVLIAGQYQPVNVVWILVGVSAIVNAFVKRDWAATWVAPSMLFALWGTTKLLLVTVHPQDVSGIVGLFWLALASLVVVAAGLPKEAKNGDDEEPPTR